MEEKEGWIKCTGSHNEQMIDWPPDNDYPGASVCTDCSFGILVIKNSAHRAMSKSGFEGKAGKLRVHYVLYEYDSVQRRMEPTSMTYKKPAGRWWDDGNQD